MKIFYSIFYFLGSISTTIGFPNGAPAGICGRYVPTGHRNWATPISRGIQIGGPYTLEVTPSFGNAVTVVLRSTQGNAFRGFLLQAFIPPSTSWRDPTQLVLPNGPGDIVGNFRTEFGSGFTQLRYCGQSSANGGPDPTVLTHTGRGDKYSVEAMWEAPNNPNIPVRFMATVVENVDNFYIVTSREILPRDFSQPRFNRTTTLEDRTILLPQVNTGAGLRGGFENTILQRDVQRGSQGLLSSLPDLSGVGQLIVNKGPNTIQPNPLSGLTNPDTVTNTMQPNPLSGVTNPDIVPSSNLQANKNIPAKGVQFTTAADGGLTASTENGASVQLVNSESLVSNALDLGRQLTGNDSTSSSRPLDASQIQIIEIPIFPDANGVIPDVGSHIRRQLAGRAESSLGSSGLQTHSDIGLTRLQEPQRTFLTSQGASAALPVDSFGFNMFNPLNFQGQHISGSTVSNDQARTESRDPSRFSSRPLIQLDQGITGLIPVRNSDVIPVRGGDVIPVRSGDVIPVRSGDITFRSGDTNIRETISDRFARGRESQFTASQGRGGSSQIGGVQFIDDQQFRAPSSPSSNRGQDQQFVSQRFGSPVGGGVRAQQFTQSRPPLSQIVQPRSSAFGVVAPQGGMRSREFSQTQGGVSGLFGNQMDLGRSRSSLPRFQGTFQSGGLSRLGSPTFGA